MQFDKDILSEHKELFLKVRDFLLSQNGITEIKKERITTYSYNNSGVCHLRTMPYGVAIGFLKGVKLTDHFMLLIGNGKTLRVLSIKAYNEIIVGHFIKEAILINKK
jgi:hypothetical protein